MRKISFLLLSLSVALIFLFLQGRQQTLSIREKLENLSKEEQKTLEFFFRSFYSPDSFGYTLFGDKPLSVTIYAIPKNEPSPEDSIDSVLNIYHPENLRKYCGWEIWKKNQNLFPMQKYAFVESKNFVEGEFTAILFINKKEFLKVVDENLNDFRKVLEREITPESLLDEVLNSENVFGHVLKNHQGLIGTLLGYGRNNAWLFHRREKLFSCFEKQSPLLGRARLDFKLSESFPRREYDYLKSVLKPFDDRGILDFNPLLLGLPNFAADLQTQETKLLKVKYENQYREIVHHFDKGNFLETTLTWMTM